MFLTPGSRAGRQRPSVGADDVAALRAYPLEGLPNSDFSLWLSRPSSGLKQTAGAGIGFVNGDIFDGWYGGPGPSSQYAVSDVLADAAGNEHAMQIAWTAAVSSGETQHNVVGQITPGYWRFTFMEYIGRMAPEYFAGQTITLEFDAKVGDANGAPKLVPIAWLSMGNLGWAASTAYLVGQIVTNGSSGEFSNPRLYRCTTAGTSAASGGPTTTSSSISDGSCVWEYVGEQKGREYELYEPGPLAVSQQIAWGDPHPIAICALSTGYQTFRKQIYVPRLDQGAGTRYAGQANDSGVRTLTPARGGGAYFGIGFDLYHNAATGPTITLKNVNVYAGTRPRTVTSRWPRDLAELAANGFQRLVGVYAPPAGASFGARGIDCKNNATTPNTQFDLDADEIVLRNALGATVLRINPGAAITNNVSTAGPAANGRDQTGAFSASSWVHFYWIWNGATLATLSSATAPPTGPTLPTGYTHWAYAGAVRFNGSSQLVRTRIRGVWATYDSASTVGVALSAGSATSETAIGLTALVPPNAVMLNVLALINAAAGATTQINVGVVSGSTVWNPIAVAAGWGSATGLLPHVGQNLYYANTQASAAAYINIIGYSLPNGGE